MQLKTIIESEPTESFNYLERYVNSVFPFDIGREYQPSIGLESFEVPFTLLDVRDADYSEIDPSQATKKAICTDKRVKFAIHPEMVAKYRHSKLSALARRDGVFIASPTSSARTVFVRGYGDCFMIKTNLEKRLGDGIRQLKTPHIEHVRRIGNEFHDSRFCDFFAYLPESISVNYCVGNEETSMIIREMNPAPNRTKHNFLIPFFSLYSRDQNAADDALLLRQILAANKQKGKKEFNIFVETILRPYLESWTDLILHRGLVPDMHAQNALLEINKDCVPVRIVIRDLQDIFVDREIRCARSLDQPYERNLMGDNQREYIVEGKPNLSYEDKKRISYSLIYDYRIARALDEFSTALKGCASYSEKRFIDAVKHIQKNKLKHIFPKKAYHLGQVQPDIGKRLVFVETNPKYR